VTALLIAAGPQASPPRDDDYLAAVRAYRSGDAEAAVARFATLDRQQISAGVAAFADRVLTEDATQNRDVTPPTADLIAAAAALHTEVALRPRVPATVEMVEVHLGIAASIVDDGVPLISIRNGPPAAKAIVVHHVTPELRRLWYVAAVTAMQRLGRVARAEAMLERARDLLPADAELLRLSGITDEVRASQRVLPIQPDDRQAALTRAEGHLRASLALAPDQSETKLRLGRVLQQRDSLPEARELLTSAARGDDPRQAYLASLFLGRLEDGAGEPASAADWYYKAAARMPSAQVARLAASELRYRAGDRRIAADDLRSAIGVRDADDPWWLYFYGEPWRVDPLLDALREMSRR
jgi:tetratricopeptide (TPR) repeat protein